MSDKNTSDRNSSTTAAAKASSHGSPDRKQGHLRKGFRPEYKTNQLFHQGDFESDEGDDESSTHDHHLPQYGPVVVQVKARPNKPSCACCCIM
ncbi:hypothetical protein Sjap_022966 [Stephania japonica]|uniref:Uncharacterized protein n=1 Tax=Stephania japonica TaxID=461633 RepID=A0AAP0HTK9_9MAGN